MSQYVYKEPKGTRYIVSIKKWNSVFANRGRWPFIYASIWVEENSATAHFYYSIYAKVFLTFLYPLMVITDGYKDANREIYRAWSQKKCGAFSCDMVYKLKDNQWERLNKLINKDKL